MFTSEKELNEFLAKLFRWFREKLLLILFSIMIVLQLMSWLELTKLPHHEADTCGTRYDDGCWLRDDDLNRLAKMIGEEVGDRMPASR
jgi:hypothetical protein